MQLSELIPRRMPALPSDGEGLCVEQLQQRLGNHVVDLRICDRGVWDYPGRPQYIEAWALTRTDDGVTVAWHLFIKQYADEDLAFSFPRVFCDEGVPLDSMPQEFIEALDDRSLECVAGQVLKAEIPPVQAAA